MNAYLEITSSHARINAIHTILLLQNSRMDDLEVSVIEANSIKNRGINIVGLGVGPDLELNQIRQIVTDPTLVQQIEYDDVGAYSQLLIQSIASFCPTGTFIIHSYRQSIWLILPSKWHRCRRVTSTV